MKSFLKLIRKKLSNMFSFKTNLDGPQSSLLIWKKALEKLPFCDVSNRLVHSFRLQLKEVGKYLRDFIQTFKLCLEENEKFFFNSLHLTLRLRQEIAQEVNGVECFRLLGKTSGFRVINLQFWKKNPLNTLEINFPFH